MKPSIGISIFNETITFFINDTTILLVFICRLLEIIPIDKIVSSIVRRVYVPADFDTIEKALSGAKAAEKGLK